MLLINGIHILVDGIIDDLIQTDLILFRVSFRKIIMTMVTRVKKGFYHNLYLANAFFSLS